MYEEKLEVEKKVNSRSRSFQNVKIEFVFKQVQRIPIRFYVYIFYAGSRAFRK